jgi:hypothetical protein
MLLGLTLGEIRQYVSFDATAGGGAGEEDTHEGYCRHGP